MAAAASVVNIVLVCLFGGRVEDGEGGGGMACTYRAPPIWIDSQDERMRVCA